jgi:hypothetical protein
MKTTLPTLSNLTYFYKSRSTSQPDSTARRATLDGALKNPELARLSSLFPATCRSDQGLSSARGAFESVTTTAKLGLNAKLEAAGSIGMASPEIFATGAS